MNYRDNPSATLDIFKIQIGKYGEY